MTMIATTEDAQDGVLALLRQILPTNGYQTDLGARIFQTAEGIPQETASPLAALIGWRDEDGGLSGSDGRMTRLTTDFEAYLDGIDDESRKAAHRLTRDLKVAARRASPFRRKQVKLSALEVGEPAPGDNFTLVRFSITVEFEERFT
ncbi:hypothetical protein [Chitinimonas lacunae]|uniref:DUF3168 domain-containing protein n=1 Tax=Chitinimonas lacunae TaxID=1963018 RepID=A0ABV8MV85_9NEIS